MIVQKTELIKHTSAEVIQYDINRMIREGKHIDAVISNTRIDSNTFIDALIIYSCDDDKG